MLLSVHGKVLNRILLERMKTTVDAKLCNSQAGLKPNRSCTDHIATLPIIIEQSLKWNSSLGVNFIDDEKAFDSVDKETLKTAWLRWSPQDHITISAVIRECPAELHMEGSFQITLRSRLDCFRDVCFRHSSSLLWSTGSWELQEEKGMAYSGHWSQLNDLDIASDLVPLSHSHAYIQHQPE